MAQGTKSVCNNELIRCSPCKAPPQPALSLSASVSLQLPMKSPSHQHLTASVETKWKRELRHELAV